MFHILGFLFIIIIAILLIGLSIVGTVIRSIFGFGGIVHPKAIKTTPPIFLRKRRNQMTIQHIPNARNYSLRMKESM